MTKRAPITEHIAAQVLVNCRRRCCLCVYLDQVDEPRPGQLAHLDRNREESGEHNLVYLCLEHHDAFDGRTSQSKGLTVEEVRHYRTLLNARFSEGNVEQRQDCLSLDMLEAAIARYYEDGASYTSDKLYLTPSLTRSLYLADKKDLMQYCRSARNIHLVHSTKGLGILPHKSIEEFLAMECSVDVYENRLTLNSDRTDLEVSMSARRWIDVKTDHAFVLVRDYLMTHGAKDETEQNTWIVTDLAFTNTLSYTMRESARALIRFTFHVGKLYRCNLNRITILCSNRAEQDWFALLNRAVCDTASSCDLLLEYPRYDFILLPSLNVRSSERRSIIHDVISALDTAPP